PQEPGADRVLALEHAGAEGGEGEDAGDHGDEEDATQHARPLEPLFRAEEARARQVVKLAHDVAERHGKDTEGKEEGHDRALVRGKSRSTRKTQRKRDRGQPDRTGKNDADPHPPGLGTGTHRCDPGLEPLRPFGYQCGSSSSGTGGERRQRRLRFPRRSPMPSPFTPAGQREETSWTPAGSTKASSRAVTSPRGRPGRHIVPITMRWGFPRRRFTSPSSVSPPAGTRPRPATSPSTGRRRR